MKALVLSLCLAAGNIAHAALDSYTDYADMVPTSSGLVTTYQMDQLNAELLENLYLEDVADASAIARVNNQMNFAGKCSSFATVKDMGQWGKLILNEMKRNRYPELYRGASDLRNACPNFNSMSDEGREMVWVMIVNAMAHLESSCKTVAPAKGPNGSLVGLLQLHNGAEGKYGKYCKRGDGKTAEGTFRCGLSMLEGQLSRDNALFSRKSYWDVLRPQAKSQKWAKIQKALKSLSICKPGAKVGSVSTENIPVPTERPTEDSSIAITPKSAVKEPTTIEEAILLGAQTAG